MLSKLHAAELNLGLAPVLSNVYLTSTTGKENARYSGAGGFGELRWKMGPFDEKTKRLFFEIFGASSLTFLKNTDINTNEHNKQQMFGWGLDCLYSFLLIGYEYNSLTSKITAPGYSASLGYNANGLRLGLKLDLFDDFNFYLFGAVTKGSVTILHNGALLSRDTTELKAMALFSFNLIRFGKKR